MSWAIEWGKIIAPILIALVGLIPTLKANRKKMQESITAVQSDIKKLQTTLDSHIKEDEQNNMKTIRYRILRFNDELCDGARPSESHFEDILDDVGTYERYSEQHKQDFKNNRGTAAMEHIDQVYRERKNNGEFQA